MSFITDFVEELTSVPGMEGVRVSPILAGDMELPAVTYNVRGGYPESYVKDSFGLTNWFIQIDIWSTSYMELDDMRQAIINHFNNRLGVYNPEDPEGGTAVSSAKFTSTRDELDNTNKLVFRTILELDILTT